MTFHGTASGSRAVSLVFCHGLSALFLGFALFMLWTSCRNYHSLLDFHRKFRTSVLGHPALELVVALGMLGVAFACYAMPERFLSLVVAYVVLGAASFALSTVQDPENEGSEDEADADPLQSVVSELLKARYRAEAEALCRRRLAVKPGDVAARLQLATALIALDRADEARAALEQGLALPDLDPDGRKGFPVVIEMMSSRHPAVFPNRPVTTVLLALWLGGIVALGALTIRDVSARHAVVLAIWVVWFPLQAWAQKTGERRERLSPRDPRPVLAAMERLAGLGRLDLAIELGRARLAGRPRDSATRLRLAVALSGAGDRSAAREELARIAAKDLRSEQLLLFDNLRARLAPDSPPPP